MLEATVLGGVLGFGLRVDLLAARPGGSVSVDTLPDPDRALLRAICDTIIPASDSPSASEAGTPLFIEYMRSNGMTAQVRAQFDAALRAFGVDASRALGMRFESASADSRFAHLDAIDAELFASRQDVARKPALDFFATMKQLTVIGYYTSARGARADLDVQLFPGTFHGSAQVKPETRTFYEDAFGVPAERPLGYLNSHG